MSAPTEPVSADAPAFGGPVLMNQDWRDLTYVHWAVPPERVAPLLPRGIRPDVLDGRTYVGLVPFRMVDAGVGARSTVPWLGTFLETNIRLYSVDARGRRGVVFQSLDADRLGVVLAARAGFRVPYRWARMGYDVSADGLEHTYSSRLRWPGVRAATTIRVRVGEPRAADALDDFVSARWRLHTRHLGMTLAVPNSHGRWPLHDATVTLEDDGLLAAAGFADLLDRAPDHTAYSPGVHTIFGLPRRVPAPGRSAG